MSIDELVNRAYTAWTLDTGTKWSDLMRAALTEQAEAYEQRIDELTGVRLTVGDGLSVYGTGEAIRRAQAYILLDSSHPSEAKDTARHFANALQAAEQRIREIETELVPGGFLSDVITAAGLLEYGMRDKGLSDRIAAGAFALLTSATATVVTEATGKPGLQVDVERVPEGWQLVPIEPTPDMLSATSWPGCAGTDYKHMLAAAPAPEGWKPVTSRCPLCEYQYGHRIGCDNNPVDIAIKAATAPKEGE